MDNSMDKIRKILIRAVSAGAFFAAALVMHINAGAAGSGYILPASSTQYLTEDMVSPMSAQIACYARNEIYARNGRMFDSAELQGYFNQQSWYMPVYEPDQFPDNLLNEYETANIAMLSSYEQQLGGYPTDGGSYSYDPVYQYMTSSGGTDSADDLTVNPDTCVLANSDSVYLTQEDISSMSAQELCYARNEIYARHGAIFNSTELSEFFGQKNWYLGTISVDQVTDDMLSDCEKTNISMLMQQENMVLSGGYILDQPGYTYSGVGSYSCAAAETEAVSDYIFPESSQRYLTDADIQGLTLQMICYGRNEIYARRGYIFQSQELRDYFNSKSWYVGTIPAAAFSPSVFNEFETANVDFLKNYEFSINADGYQVY